MPSKLNALGKSFTCSHIVEHFQQKLKKPVVYYYYSSRRDQSQPLQDLLQSVVSQLLLHDRDVAPAIMDRYISQGLRSTNKNLKAILELLLSSTSPVWLIVDGVDEIESSPDEQKQILRYLARLRHCQDACRVLISSRQLPPQLATEIRSAVSVCLDDYPEEMSQNIQAFVEDEIGEIKSRFGPEIAATTVQALVANANGRQTLRLSFSH